MAVILGTRKYLVEQCLEDATKVAPTVWAHRRAMLGLSKMNAIDQETFIAMCKEKHPFTRNLRWVSSMTLTEATFVNYHYPEVFNDVTGKAMRKFLARNRQYCVERA